MRRWWQQRWPRRRRADVTLDYVTRRHFRLVCTTWVTAPRTDATLRAGAERVEMRLLATWGAGQGCGCESALLPAANARGRTSGRYVIERHNLGSHLLPPFLLLLWIAKKSMQQRSEKQDRRIQNILRNVYFSQNSKYWEKWFGTQTVNNCIASSNRKQLSTWTTSLLRDSKLVV